MISWFARFMLMILLLLPTSCAASDLGFDRAEVGVIYTDALRKDSELVLFDQGGERIGSRRFNEMGIFRIVPDERDWLLPVRFGKGWIRLTREGKETKENPRQFPIDVLSKPGILLASYNSGLHTNTLEMELKKEGRTYRVELDGFLRVLDADEQKVYVFADVVRDKKSLLYVLDRKTGKVEREISLETGEADDILLSGGRVLLSSRSGGGRIAVVDKKNWQVRYVTLPYAEPQYLLPDGDRILVTHAGAEGRISILDAATLRVRGTVQLPQPIYKVRQANGKLYVLTQLHSREKGGEIGVYSIKDWKREMRWELPVVRDTLVQDLEVVGRGHERE
ncbi:hypothetical protein JIR001_11420 [Polycladomyces abyssicola]|uniref:Uncharacterized protein n=1 Tax=Polycladomyces abyssicola TaxID=1125966 RepID=A0A8D5ZKC6_9BACL|nr:hypothetical protein [Polycladomyces abyssicola]BCU81359.1 hypothetical protein JIR001_11420 [Polycladomyces abyssicola]